MSFIPLVNINRGLWKQKPQPWGNQADVASNLKDRLEAIGIAYEDCVLGMPLFNPGDQLDYSKNGFEFLNNGAVFDKNAFDFDGTAIPFSLVGTPTVTYPFTLILEVSIADVNTYGLCQFGSSGSNYGGIYANTGATNDTIALSVTTTAGSASNHRRTFGSNSDVSDQYVNTLGTIIIVVRGTSTCEMYCNGVDEFSTISGTYLSNPVFGSNSYIGDRYTDDSHFYLDGSMNQIMLLDTGISKDQVLSLSDNKWQLWQPPTKIFYSFAEAITTTPPTTIGPTTLPPTTLAPTTIVTTLAPTTVVTTIAPTTIPPTTSPPTTLPPTTVSPTTIVTTLPPTTLAPTTIVTTPSPTTLGPTTPEPTLAPTTLAPTEPPTTAVPTTLPPTLPPTTLGPTTPSPIPIVTRRGRSNMGFSLREQWR